MQQTPHPEEVLEAIYETVRERFSASSTEWPEDAELSLNPRIFVGQTAVIATYEPVVNNPFVQNKPAQRPATSLIVDEAVPEPTPPPVTAARSEARRDGRSTRTVPHTLPPETGLGLARMRATLGEDQSSWAPVAATGSTVGRADVCTLPLPDRPGVSAVHVEITSVAPGTVKVVDLDSRYGTWALLETGWMALPARKPVDLKLPATLVLGSSSVTVEVEQVHPK